MSLNLNLRAFHLFNLSSFQLAFFRVYHIPGAADTCRMRIFEKSITFFVLRFALRLSKYLTQTDGQTSETRLLPTLTFGIRLKGSGNNMSPPPPPPPPSRM